jgi:hypothetical protein
VEWLDLRIKAILRVSGGQQEMSPTRRYTMQDLLTALAFVAIIVAPCIIANVSGSREIKADTY